jgi:hypothetical protein
MPDESSTVEAAKSAAVEQAIILVFSMLGLAYAVWAQRHLSDPDWFRGRRMTVSKKAERAYAHAAAWCWRRAERARLQYERDRA